MEAAGKNQSCFFFGRRFALPVALFRLPVEVD